MDNSTFITRVRLKNYKSIAECDVKLGPLQFLVGPNGSGKSNFLDALRFVTTSLNGTFSDAVSERGGLSEILFRWAPQPAECEIGLEFQTRDRLKGKYVVGVGGTALGGSFGLHREELTFVDSSGSTNYYAVETGQVKHSSIPNPPIASLDRLYLVRLSGLQEFRPIYDALANMEFYNLNPDRIREPQAHASHEALVRDGRNLASVLLRLQAKSPEVKARIEEFLREILPSVEGVRTEVVGSVEFLHFMQRPRPSESPRGFFAGNMSDGTLRALGNLVALFQYADDARLLGSLVGIEEPETALHPAAAGVLRDALREASNHAQVVVTSHSPDLLDDPSVSESEIIAVASENGATNLGPLDEASRTAVRDKLYTPGDLLRMNQLQPEPEDAHEKVS